MWYPADFYSYAFYQTILCQRCKYLACGRKRLMLLDIRQKMSLPVNLHESTTNSVKCHYVAEILLKCELSTKFSKLKRNGKKGSSDKNSNMPCVLTRTWKMYMYIVQHFNRGNLLSPHQRSFEGI